MTLPAKSPGRPPGSRSLRAKAARHTCDSIRVLAEVQVDESAPYMARVVAAQTLIEVATTAPAKRKAVTP